MNIRTIAAKGARAAAAPTRTSRAGQVIRPGQGGATTLPKDSGRRFACSAAGR